MKIELIEQVKNEEDDTIKESILDAIFLFEKIEVYGKDSLDIFTSIEGNEYYLMTSGEDNIKLIQENMLTNTLIGYDVTIEEFKLFSDFFTINNGTELKVTSYLKALFFLKNKV